MPFFVIPKKTPAVQTTEIVKEEWNICSLLVNFLPKKNDIAEKKNSCIAIKNKHRNSVKNKLLQVRKWKYYAIIQCKAKRTCQ